MTINDPFHGQSGPNYNWPTQGNAHGVAFLEVPTGAWNYGRLEGNGSVVMTDANLANEPAQGGMFATLDKNMTVYVQAGKQPINHVPNLGGFVDYCHNQYSANRLFFFVYFQ